MKRLNEQYASAQATRLETLHLETIYRAGMLAGVLHQKFETYLKDVAQHSYRKAMGGRVVAINKPAFEETLRTTFNGRNYSQQIWGNTDDLAVKLKEVFKQAFIRGDGPQEMARAIRKEFNVARSRAETLVRTDGTAIMVRGTIKRYQDEGLKYYRVLVKLDERTTDICRGIAHENKLYLLDEAVAGVTAPPFHYNCRSTIMPDKGELNGEYGTFQDFKQEMAAFWGGDRESFSAQKTGYSIGTLSSNPVLGDLANKSITFEKRSLDRVLNKHGSEFSLVEMLLIDTVLKKPTVIASNEEYHKGSFLLYGAIPERANRFMEMVVIPDENGGYIIHYHKIRKSKVNKLKKEGRILYSESFV